ncbi:zinc finger protein SNAI3 [Carettochelys insculpta]|uniref:zinc finger protein SNAI3 n=1 Tax=Carettochelys insculpta TaxID=44489 RepID=UPI003EB776CD
MPRSFLVKKPSSTRVPNYGQLETRRRQETSGACQSCGERLVPILLPSDSAPATPRAGGSLLARIALPLPPAADAKGAPGASPRCLELSLVDALTGRGLGTPLKDNQNNLNLPPAPSLPRRLSDPRGPAEGARGAQAKGPGARGGDPPESFQCLGCPKCSHSFSGLAKPRCLLQARSDFPCKYCAKAYGSLGALKMHLRTHTLPCVCKICGKAFSRPWLLQGHIRTHTGEKPYSCSHCSRAFADRSNLRAHLQTHSDIKKYQCRGCSKTFSRVSLLSRHEEGGCCPAP